MSISIDTPENVTKLKLSRIVEPRIGGTVNLSGFTNLKDINVQGNFISGIDFDYSNNQYEIINTFLNRVSGNIEDISNQSSLTLYNVSSNDYTGEVSSLPDNLQTYNVSSNDLTGQAPVVSNCTNLVYYYIARNNFTGEFPNLNSNTNLKFVSISENKFTGQLNDLSNMTSLEEMDTTDNNFTGEIPSFATSATNLKKVWVKKNDLTGSIPDITPNLNLSFLNCNQNNLTGWAGTSFTNNFINLYASDNDLSSDTVDAILAAFVTANNINGKAFLGGSNAPASSAGVASKSILIGRGWSVFINE
jgi:hypothetical protein